MADSPIPVGDLPFATPGAFDSVVGVDESTGAARRFPMPVAGTPTAYATLADLPASAPEGTPAYVNNDSTAANNGLWAYMDGAWVQSADRTTGVEARVTTAEADIAALEAIDAGTRLDAAEPKIEALETIDAGTRLDQAESALSENEQDILALEAIDAGTRLAAAEPKIAALEQIDAGNRLDSAEATLDDTVPQVDWLRGGQLYRDALPESEHAIADRNGRLARQVLRDGSVLIHLLRLVATGDTYRDAAPFRACIQDAEGRAVLTWSDAGEVDFLPSQQLRDRLAGSGTITPDGDGYYTFNMRGDGTHTYATVQSPDQNAYEVVSLDASETGTRIVSGPGVIEGILFYGQSNAGPSGSGRVVTGAHYPAHVFGFSESDPNSSVSLQTGLNAVDAESLTDLLPMEDYTSSSGHAPATLTGFALEWHRRNRGLGSSGVFLRTDYQGGQPITAFVRDTTLWTNLMTSAAKMAEVCESYGRTAVVKALVWIQGENETIAGANYGEDLNALLDDVLPELQVQTGQPNLPLAMVVQTNTTDTKPPGEGVSAVNEYQLAVAKERYGRDTIMPGPMYMCPLVDPIHATAIGRMILAEMIAHAYIVGPTFKPLWPTSATLDGDKITVAFDIPGLGLAFDSDWVKTVDNYGFSFEDSTSSASISSVAIVGDTVEITLSNAPSGSNPTLCYADGSDTEQDGWASGRGLLYSPTEIPSYYAALGYEVPETLRHYCVKFRMEITQ